jgi:hypothetical protein
MAEPTDEALWNIAAAVWSLRDAVTQAIGQHAALTDQAATRLAAAIAGIGNPNPNPVAQAIADAVTALKGGPNGDLWTIMARITEIALYQHPSTQADLRAEAGVDQLLASWGIEQTPDVEP